MALPASRQNGAARNYSLLVYSFRFGLIRLKCPFKAIALVDLQKKNRGVVEVEYVQFLPNLPYFKTAKGLAPCYHFAIII